MTSLWSDHLPPVKDMCQTALCHSKHSKPTPRYPGSVVWAPTTAHGKALHFHYLVLYPWQVLGLTLELYFWRYPWWLMWILFRTSPWVQSTTEYMLASRPKVGNNEARIDRNIVTILYSASSSRNDTPILGACWSKTLLWFHVLAHSANPISW